MREGWDYGSRSAGMGTAEWGDWNRVDCSIEIVPSQVTGFCEIDHRVRKSGSGENRSRDLPSLHEEIGAAAVEHGFDRELPHIVRIEGVTNVVICRSVAAPQMRRVLRVFGTACSEFVKAAVGVRDSGCGEFSDTAETRVGTGRNGRARTDCGRKWTPSVSIG